MLNKCDKIFKLEVSVGPEMVTLKAFYSIFAELGLLQDHDKKYIDQGTRYKYRLLRRFSLDSHNVMSSFVLFLVLTYITGRLWPILSLRLF